MASHPNISECKKFWADFLLLYKNLPALWKLKSAEYRDRKLKKKCYEDLIEKLREIDPEADRKAVVKKINTFRGNFRREHKKTLLTQDSDKPYTSNLWYYELMEFLHGELRCRSSRNDDSQTGDEDYTLDDYDEDDDLPLTDEYDDGQYDEDIAYEFDAFCKEEDTRYSSQGEQMPNDDEDITNDIECVLINGENMEALEYPNSADMKPTQSELEQSTNALVFYGAPAAKKRRLESGLRTKVENSDDDVDDVEDVESCALQPEYQASSALARTWESQYNELSNKQKILARKMISDIFYYGCLGQLNEMQAARLQKLFQIYSTNNVME